MFFLIQLEQFRKQKAAKKASQSSNNTTETVDNSQRNVTDSDGAVASMSNGPLKQSDETNSKSSFSGDVNNLSFSNTVTNDGSKETSKKDDGYESVGKVDFSSSRLELNGLSKDLTVDNNRPEVVPYISNVEKQSSESFDRASALRENDGVSKGISPFRGNTVLSSSMQMDGFSYGSGLNSSREGMWLSYEVDVIMYFVIKGTT